MYLFHNSLRFVVFIIEKCTPQGYFNAIGAIIPWQQWSNSEATTDDMGV